MTYLRDESVAAAIEGLALERTVLVPRSKIIACHVMRLVHV